MPRSVICFTVSIGKLHARVFFAYKSKYIWFTSNNLLFPKNYSSLFRFDLQFLENFYLLVSSPIKKSDSIITEVLYTKVNGTMHYPITIAYECVAFDSITLITETSSCSDTSRMLCHSSESRKNTVGMENFFADFSSENRFYFAQFQRKTFVFRLIFTVSHWISWNQVVSNAVIVVFNVEKLFALVWFNLTNTLSLSPY